MMHLRPKTWKLSRRPEAVIPGGMYGHHRGGLADDYPQFFAPARVRIMDVDGSRYLD